MKPELRIDWASYDAANYACKHWHYSKCIPAGKLVKVGAWEGGVFIGVVIFGRGANKHLVSPFGLNQDEGCELVRIALTKHCTPVSKIMTLAVKYLKQAQPKLRVVVSYADPDQGHHGGIYQACNWVYTGAGGSDQTFWYKGKWTHRRTISSAGIDPSSLPRKKSCGKYRYVLPLDRAMHEKIAAMSQPYPKRVKQAMTGDQLEQRRCDTDPPAPCISLSEPNAILAGVPL